MPERPRRRGGAWSLCLALLALALLLAPGAEGAPPWPFGASSGAAAGAPGAYVSFTLEHVGRVDPDRERVVNVTVTLCSGTAFLTSPGRQEVELRLSRAPGWLSARLEPPVYGFVPVTLGDCQSQAGLVRLRAAPEAPGFKLAQFTLEANLKGADATAVGYEENVTFVSGFHGDIDVTAPATVTATPGEQGGFDVTVANRGNSLTRIRFDVVEAPAGVAVTSFDGASGGLAPAGQSGDSRAFRFTIALGDNAPDEAFDVKLLVSSHYYFDSSIQGESETVTVHVDPDGASAAGSLFEVPAPTPLPLLLAAAGVALLLARRR